jgi:hypothetical protein
MTRPRFLADHDLNDHVRLGVWRVEPAVEFAALRDFGLDRRSDEEVLGFAGLNQWILVSHDYKTIALGRAPPDVNGKANERLPPVIETLILIWSDSEGEEWVNLIAYLPF